MSIVFQRHQRKSNFALYVELSDPQSSHFLSFDGSSFMASKNLSFQLYFYQDQKLKKFSLAHTTNFHFLFKADLSKTWYLLTQHCMFSKLAEM